MYDIIAVTNRQLCRGDFLGQIERLAASSVQYIILREKDLASDEYYELAKAVLAVCRRYNKSCLLHGNAAAAAELGAAGLHLPLSELRRTKRPAGLKLLGTSVHSLEEAAAAKGYGADYLLAGHIFPTDCKRGVKPRGLDFLRAVCQSVSPLPVYAIGGITLARMPQVLAQGAAGGCMMSECMKADSELLTL